MECTERKIAEVLGINDLCAAIMNSFKQVQLLNMEKMRLEQLKRKATLRFDGLSLLRLTGVKYRDKVNSAF